MKNHPASEGPYKCPMFQTCGKMLESGAKLQKHMYVHVGRRAKSIAQGQKFVCPLQQVSPTILPS